MNESLSQQRLLELALVGSRMPGFHHDAASKLQSLMMALDEISELSEDADPAVRSAIDTAHTALRELHQMFTANRALTKPPQRTGVMLRDLVQRAAERVGVKVRGELPECVVHVPAPAITHVLAQLLDIAAGPSHLGRVVDASLHIDDTILLALSGPLEAMQKPVANAGEVVALAAFVLEREGGALAAGERYEIRLPRRIDTTQEVPKTT